MDRRRSAVLNLENHIDMEALRNLLQSNELRIKNPLPAVCKTCLRTFASKHKVVLHINLSKGSGQVVLVVFDFKIGCARRSPS